ncbi:sensor histidine kinase [Kordiimonas marina]|uniref:sensor histidine kinase n=1 Tax=Kordiimonas marina TaxID=2872312 RepID=UPI001FF3E942|nr:histidine kinase [Kordiimonas marina]MCJ9427936.1 histidine kinase [Kordiimonas marina]
MNDTSKNMVGSGRADTHNAPASHRAQGLGGQAFADPVPDLGWVMDKAGAGPSMDNLFGSKERTFWIFQIVGWIGYSFVRMFQWMVNGWDFEQYFTMVLAATLIGFVMTVGLRYLYQRVQNMNLIAVLVTVFIASGILGAFYSAGELMIQPYVMPGLEPYRGLQRLGNAMFESTVLFAWSSIYFGYHYYRGFQEQQAQALKATAMAHQAQLKMLRYQLNPHFLFNTLNAISTLVLDQSVTDANKMLTKLSSFLRYTLVNQPTHRVTLEQELYALELYLEIEKVRFGDRLHLEFDIEERAKSALIPSLLLQPLIENAIKYAVAPAEEGGSVSVSARVEGDKLKVVLADTGPGLPDINNIVSQSGSGVGIVNTKERLLQIYGSDYRFILQNLTPSGLSITIVIPCEHEKRALKPSEKPARKNEAGRLRT